MMIEVIVQYFRGCPNSLEMIKRVKEAVNGIPNVDYKEILIETEELARKFGFRGSPTLLINGKDFENMPIPPNPTLACRVYLKGLPTVEEIRTQIVAHLNKKL